MTLQSFEQDLQQDQTGIFSTLNRFNEELINSKEKYTLQNSMNKFCKFVFFRFMTFQNFGLDVLSVRRWVDLSSPSSDNFII